MKSFDLLIVNANILTLNSHNDRARSLAVTDGKISEIWFDSKPPKDKVRMGSKTEIIDLKGATLIPGFIDTHNHILQYSQTFDQVDCSSPLNSSIADIMNAIGEKARQTALGQWVQGYGYDDTLLYEKRHPTRSELDKVSPNNPVYLRHISGHIWVANSIALELAGLNDQSSAPSGGHLGREVNGRLNGVVYETARELIRRIIPRNDDSQLIENLGKASKEYVSQGITTNTDAGLGLVFGPEELDIHLKAAKNKVNPMNTRLMVMHDLLREDGRFGGYTPHQLNKKMLEESGGLVQLDGVKLFQDGSIQGLTGALRNPYYKYPDVTGDLIQNQQEFQKEILDLHKRGFRISIHGNGDRAIESILHAYEYAIKNSPRNNHQHRIEHVQTASYDDIVWMKKLNVAGSFFINHVYYWGDRHAEIFLGPKRANRINPLADALENDVLLTLHSDCPVTPISPLFSIWAAVNRITKEGEILGQQQCIDVETALKAMTIFGAKLNFDDETTGSIELGKRADFVALEEDPTRVNPIKIKDIAIKSTFINGILVFEEENKKN